VYRKVRLDHLLSRVLSNGLALTADRRSTSKSLARGG
jgi:hypothetical protein